MKVNDTTLLFRKAVNGDIDEICEILSLAVKRMLAEGKCQWNESYPTRRDVENDLLKSIAYVIESAGKVIAYGAVVTDGEPAYTNIDGSWLSDKPYIVIHRLAVHPNIECRGVGMTFLCETEKIAKSLSISSFRIDTNYDNQRMLALACKFGFKYCGEIIYQKGSRKAFEKILVE